MMRESDIDTLRRLLELARTGRVVGIAWVAATLAVSLPGCASVQDRIAAAPTKSSYTLCDNLATATLADARVRDAWAAELARRGENCGQHLGMIQANQQSQAQAMELARRLQQQPRQAAPQGQAAAFLKGSYVSGMNRICVYDRLGSEVAITLRSVDICPLSQ